MAEIKSFPNNQDVYVGAEWVMKWFHGRTSGVFGADGNVSVSAVQDSMSVEVSDGIGWMSNSDGDGVVWWNDSEKSSGLKLNLEIEAADGVLDRIDRVVVTWETTNYVSLPTISILTGNTSSNPVAPALTNNTTKRQISLAKIFVPAGTVSLTNSLVTDERLNSSVCGIVTERVSVDTSMINAQFSDMLNKLERELENVKSGTAHVLKTGDTMIGSLVMSGNNVKELGEPEEETDATTKQYVDNKFSESHPVGSIYMSVNSTSPAIYFGGTWAQLEDRFLLGAGSTYSNGETGGEAKHTLTINEIPAHNHKMYARSVYNGGGSYIAICNKDNSDGKSYVTDSKGGGAPHNIMPPYLVVYMWKRVA